MSSSKSDSKGGSNALLWVGGLAATAGVFYFTTRYLKERDELMEMKLMEKLRGGTTSNPALPEGDD